MFLGYCWPYWSSFSTVLHPVNHFSLIPSCIGKWIFIVLKLLFYIRLHEKWIFIVLRLLFYIRLYRKVYLHPSQDIILHTIALESKFSSFSGFCFKSDCIRKWVLIILRLFFHIRLHGKVNLHRYSQAIALCPIVLKSEFSLFSGYCYISYYIGKWTRIVLRLFFYIRFHWKVGFKGKVSSFLLFYIWLHGKVYFHPS